MKAEFLFAGQVARTAGEEAKGVRALQRALHRVVSNELASEAPCQPEAKVDYPIFPCT